MSYNPSVGGGGVSDGDKGDITVSGSGEGAGTITPRAGSFMKAEKIV